jgi:hypothetical protein
MNRTIVLWAILIFIAIGTGVFDQYMKTPSQTDQRVAQVTAVKHLCKAIAECSDYANARQACATAGNFDTCMTVKLGQVPEHCSNDGKLLVTFCDGCGPARLPNAFQCVMNDFEVLFTHTP